jgi:hypothetical protein
MKIKPTYKIIQFYITRLDHLLIQYCETVIAKANPKQFENEINAIIELNTKTNKKTGETKKPTRRQAILMYANQYAEKLSENNIE